MVVMEICLPCIMNIGQGYNLKQFFNDFLIQQQMEKLVK